MLMIICRIIKFCFDKVVQFIDYPDRSVVRVPLFFTMKMEFSSPEVTKTPFSRLLLFPLILLSGCNNWPEPAERVLAISQRQLEIPEPVDAEYIENLVAISRTRLEILTSSGARYCLPGQIYKIDKHLLRARHEVDGNLLLDAQYTLAKAMDQLDKTAELMMGLAQGSECLEAYSYADMDIDKVDAFVTRLSRLLNCQCDQISKDGAITEGFAERLSVAAKAMSAHEPLQLNIFSSQNSEQAEEILVFFSNHGVRKTQITIRHEGGNNLQLSQDGFWFDISMGQTEKLFKLKEWKRDFRLMSIQKEKADER